MQNNSDIDISIIKGNKLFNQNTPFIKIFQLLNQMKMIKKVMLI